MNPATAPQRPTERRPFSWGAVAGPLALALVAFPAFAWFAWHDGLATVGDDSVSYLVQARVYAGTAGAAVREWLGNAAHFPPLFPLLLAASGAADDFLRAHLVVAACAAAALAAVHVFVRGVAGGRAAALVVALFLATPTAWLGELGILSEPLYLLLSFAALAWHARSVPAGAASTASRLVFGVLLAAAFLSRSAAAALVAAYVAWALLRAWKREEAPGSLAVALVPLALATAAWLALRPPLQGENYGQVLRNAWGLLMAAPALFASKSAEYLGNAWIGSFTAESHVSGATRAALLAAALLALAGAVRAARLNRLDGWYALAYAAMLAFWLFPEETARRLMYPVVPLALLHAGEAIHALARRVAPRRPALAVGAGGALLAALSLPAMALLASKAADRSPVMSISPLAYSGIMEYYTIIPVKPARESAGRQVAVLAGLAQVERFTPPDAKVLWMRPDYVAVLGHRTGVASYYRGGMAGVVRTLLETHAGYIVVSSLYKADIRGDALDPLVTPGAVAPFTRPVFIVRNPVAEIDEFGLLQVDRAALERYAATLPGAPGR